MSGSNEIWIQRWNFHHRLQHLLLILSIALLVVTGFPIKFPQAPWAVFIMNTLGGFENLYRFHLVAAVIMLSTGVYHVVYLLVYWRTRGATWEMLPSMKDLKDAVQHVGFLLGLARERPKFGRYSYLEKFEYYAVFWGMAIMGLSGFALWFPELAIRYLPRWVLDVLRVVHSNEAFVALLAVAFGHFFFVHFCPNVFPTSMVWFNGKISLHHMAEEHPLELERMDLESLGVRKEELKELKPSRWCQNRALAGIELVVYLAMVVALLSYFLPQLFS